jgi:carbonic anhydrase/acetyltransferase-like protein (isoleucine patch superfamily)
MLIEINGKKPTVAPDAFVAPTAVLIGDVVIESGASVWWGAVIRADWNSIRVGPRTSVQDNCVVHCTVRAFTAIGADVTVGHAAVLHGCTVKDGALIGINSTVLDGAVVGEKAVVSAGSVVTPGTQVEPGWLVGGVPSKPIKELAEKAREAFNAGKLAYEELAKQYLRSGIGVGHQDPDI